MLRYLLIAGLAVSPARNGRALILPSLLGFELSDAAPLRDGLALVDSAPATHDEWWTGIRRG